MSSSSSGAVTPVPLSVCRCCLAEGCEKDMLSQYRCFGVEEVYADILKETFDIEFLLVAEDGSDTYHICDTCIVELRQAFQFKQRTIRSAMKFQQHIDKLNMTRAGDNTKQEKEEGNVSEDFIDYGSECFSVEALDDDSDDPETATQTESISITPMKRKITMEAGYELKKAKVVESGDKIKENTEFEIQIAKPVEPGDKPSESRDNGPNRAKPKLTVKTRENEPNKTKDEVPRGKIKVMKGQNNAAKESARDLGTSLHNTIAGSKTHQTDITVADDNVIPDNILMLLEWSNICLFHYNSSKGKYFKCYVCTETFAELRSLRAHTESHDKADMIIKILRSKMDTVISAEISYLSCKCGLRCEKLSDLMKHLTDEHKIPFEDKSLDNLETYKIVQNGLFCDMCDSSEFNYFGRLRHHMQETHLKQNIDMCDVCGKVFKGVLTARQMKEHKKNFHATRKNLKCKKTIDIDNLVAIVSNSTACPFHWPSERPKPYKCYCCPQHFEEFKDLRHHFTSNHDMDSFRAEMKEQAFRQPLKVDITGLKCTNCEEPCEDLEILRLHLSDRHSIESDEAENVIALKIEEGYKCLVCQDEFEGWVPLNRHLRVDSCVSTLSSSNKFACEDCGKRFVGKKTWRAHMKHIHSDDKMNPTTALRANTKILLGYSNMTIFTFEDVLFRCFSCHETFMHFTALMTHSDTHDVAAVDAAMKLTKNAQSYNIKADITDLKCNVCQNAFEQIEEFQTHLIESHQVTFFKEGKHYLMPYMVRNGMNCGFCKQSFPVSQSLIRHVNSHGGGEVCEHCGKAFIHAYELKRHKRRSHGEVKCLVCNITFANYKARQRHNKKHHEGEGRKKKFECVICKTNFTCSEFKYRHMKSEHGYQHTEYNCVSCDKVFCTKGAYENHMKSHEKMATKMIPCKYCSTSFLPEKFEAHIQHSHKEAHRSRCYVCRNMFASPNLLCDHLIDSHSDNASYCPLCEYLPEDMESLLNHVRIDHKIDNMFDSEWMALINKRKVNKTVIITRKNEAQVEELQ